MYIKPASAGTFFNDDLRSPNHSFCYNIVPQYFFQRFSHILWCFVNGIYFSCSFEPGASEFLVLLDTLLESVCHYHHNQKTCSMNSGENKTGIHSFSCSAHPALMFSPAAMVWTTDTRVQFQVVFVFFPKSSMELDSALWLLRDPMLQQLCFLQAVEMLENILRLISIKGISCQPENLQHSDSWINGAPAWA